MWARGRIQRKRRTKEDEAKGETRIALLESRDDYGKLVWTTEHYSGGLPGLDQTWLQREARLAAEDRNWEIADAPGPDCYEHRSLFLWMICTENVSAGLVVVVCMVIPRGYRSLDYIRGLRYTGWAFVPCLIGCGGESALMGFLFLSRRY